ncbi:MAG: thymidylate kinase, partial [Oscillospiraceae bacterium]|nr:thymidylate kinase [Oscillospiraceae bacterium]
LMTERYNGDEKRKDIHEANVGYLKLCRRSALYAAERLGWRIVSCSRDGDALPIGDISERLMQLIKEVL